MDLQFDGVYEITFEQQDGLPLDNAAEIAVEACGVSETSTSQTTVSSKNVYFTLTTPYCVK